MPLIEEESVTAALEELLTKQHTTGDPIVYASRIKEGNPTTLSFDKRKGEDIICVTWCIPFEYIAPIQPISPEDVFLSNAHSLPDHIQLDTERQTSTVEDLGIEAQQGWETILEGIKNIEYPVENPDIPLVLSVNDAEFGGFCEVSILFSID